MNEAVAPSPTLVLTPEAGGKVRLQYLSTAGQTNWISISSNLVNWALLGSGVADTNGVLQFEDHGSTELSQRFYRVLPQPPPSLALQFGMFVNWSNASFTGRSTESDGDWADWPSPYATPNQSTETFFAPPGLEDADVTTLQATVTDRWVELARNAGMTHLLFDVKSVDGFCLWDSSATRNFCITCPSRSEAHILHSDLAKAVSQSCAAKGSRLGFYYCLADQHDGWNSASWVAPGITKQHLTELLGGRYGAIDYVFLDIGYGGQDLKPEGILRYYVNPSQRQDLVDFIHGQGLDPNGSQLSRLGLPNVLVGFNDPEEPFRGDYRCIENGHPEFNPELSTEFSFPIISGPNPNRLSWFYTTPGQENRCMSLSDLRDYYDRSLDTRSIFDLGVGPDQTGQIRKIDAETLNSLAQALSNSPSGPSAQPNHFLINDDGARINGCPNGTLSYGPGGGWAYRAARGLGGYSDDAHLTTTAGDYCQFQFTGTAVEFISSKSSYAGSVDVYLDDACQTPSDGLGLHSQSFMPRQVVFAAAGLPLGTHTIKVVSRVDGLEVVVDAFRVFSGVPQSISVEDSGCVWVVDSEHLIWTYHPAVTNSPAFWVRMPGTGSDIGCGSSVWKIGTDVPQPSLSPHDYSISRWLGPTLEWRRMLFGESDRIDVASDESVWAVNNAGEIGYYPTPTNSLAFTYTGAASTATDVGCQSAGGPVVARIGPDFTIASWTLSQWQPVEGEGARIDVAANGDLWVVDGTGELWQCHSGQWSWKAANALDVGCGATGDVWYVSEDGTIQRVIDP